MTVLEALQIIQMLAPLAQQALAGGQTTITQAQLDAAAANLSVDENTLLNLILAKRAAGK